MQHYECYLVSAVFSEATDSCSYNVKDERAVASRPLFSIGATVLLKRKSEACGRNSLPRGRIILKRQENFEIQDS
jgi:hypothetical protein